MQRVHVKMLSYQSVEYMFNFYNVPAQLDSNLII